MELFIFKAAVFYAVAFLAPSWRLARSTRIYMDEIHMQIESHDGAGTNKSSSRSSPANCKDNPPASRILPRSSLLGKLGNGISGDAFNVRHETHRVCVLKVMSKVLCLDVDGVVKRRLGRPSLYNATKLDFEPDDDDHCVNPFSKKAFDREVEAQARAAAAGLAPPIFEHEISEIGVTPFTESSEIYGVILMGMAKGVQLNKWWESEAKKAKKAGTNILASSVPFQKLNSVASAIAKLHSVGIYHGDLQFEHVFFDGDQVGFIDFGKARIFKPGTLSSEMAVHDELVFSDNCETFINASNQAARDFCKKVSQGITSNPPPPTREDLR